MPNGRTGTRKARGNGKPAKNYQHPTSDSPMRPEVGTQAQFKKKLPPKKYRYDDSLSPALEWGNVRKGFFSSADFRAVVANLPEHLRDFCRFAYCTGMRKGEICSLRWEDVDGDVIGLRAENAKNGEARSIPLEGELAEIMDRRRAVRKVETGGAVMLSTWIFHRDGVPIGDFRKAWATACKLAGVPGRLFHDFRRTAVRDMVRAGVAETVAMRISGHKTRSMFDRYNITDERDQREALRQTEDYRQQQAQQQKVVSIQ